MMYLRKQVTKIEFLLFFSYMSMLDVEKMDNPMLSGGFKITLGLSDNHSASIGLGDTIFNLNGQYYKIKNSNISITTVIKYFLAI